MTPKDEGQGLMMSPFVSRDFGFDFNITPSQMEVVNEYRKGKQYKDVDAALLKKGNANKMDLVKSPFSRKI